MRTKILPFIVLLGLLLLACSAPVVDRQAVDWVVRNGQIYDGSGASPQLGGVAVDQGRIVAVGDVTAYAGNDEIDAGGLAIAPGFINVLSWAVESLIVDGRGQSDLRQGVTLEIFGEGTSMGPLNEAMKKEMLERQQDIRYDIDWTTLGEYLESMVARGISLNVASFVGATTVRIHELGYEDRPPDAAELARMQDLVRQAMAEGALGVGSSLIYAPAFYASTDELIALTQVAGEYGGGYISHLRSEGGRLLESVDELLTIGRESGVQAEIYHLKASGEENWGKLDEVIAKVEAARAAGQAISADMYNYTAGATGLDASMPPWVQEGGHDAWVERLRDPAIRERLRGEILTPTDDWENLFLAAGSAEKILLIGFKNEALKPLTGKTLAAVAAERGTSLVDTMMDLVVEDDSRVEAIYFLMSEDNVRRQLQLPWVSFGSDAEASAPDGVFLKSSTHPRAYGNVARLLGHYVRDEGLVPLEEAIRRLTSLPATNWKLRHRGALKEGYHADIVVFDPATIQDHATFKDPLQFATGVRHVLVNGSVVLRDGEPNGVTAGQVVRGPGWTGWPQEGQ
jgi:N-acyl-D-amino-acid deacylase